MFTSEKDVSEWLNAIHSDIDATEEGVKKIKNQIRKIAKKKKKRK